MIEDNHVVFIGGKPFMNYVTGVVMQFTTQGADEVVVPGIRGEQAKQQMLEEGMIEIDDLAWKHFQEEAHQLIST